MMLIRTLDTETTGLDPTIHRICEIGTVDLIINSDPQNRSLSTVTRGRMWSSLVNPQMPISVEAMACHDITDEMVKDAPTVADLIPTIIDGPPDYFCAHNSRFDRAFIDPIAGVQWLDTYRIALWLCPDAPSHKNSVLRYWLKLKLSINEQMVVDGSPGGGGGAWIRSHRALWDAYVTAAILRRAIVSGATLEDMVLVSSQPALLPRLRFGEHAMKPIAEVPSSYLQWIVDKFEASKEDERHTAITELNRRRGSAYQC